jgi:hypothetical protein
MDLDDALSSRDHIKAKLKAAISDDISDWGVFHHQLSLLSHGVDVLPQLELPWQLAW